MLGRFVSFLAVILVISMQTARAGDGNRFAYLDENDPYYVSRSFPKLITPQWVGEDGVEAVVILAIDDMRDHKKYETYLRPILKRLKKIDGRAPVSIMTNRIDPKLPHLQAWLKEGVSLETHTYDHPCPFFKSGKFETAKSTYDRCVDLLCDVPNSKPVAFRMPCCDSLNTPSPRFYAEIFNRTTSKGNFLTIDTSVFHLFTPNDPELPRELVMEEGRERFRKYMPRDRTFVNTIEDYPYPYVLGRLCWEFPCMVPSDWEAQHLHKPNNPLTVRDWQAALDATVIKKGVFSMVFHPHGWIRNDQMVQLIDYAVRKHGKRVKFLTFREAQERMNKNLLAGQPIRHPKHGGDNGVRLLDLNGDGYLDVVIGNDDLKRTRIWSPKESKWIEVAFPTTIDDTARFGILQLGAPTLLSLTEKLSKAWRFDGKRWVEDSNLLKGLDETTRGMHLRDLDGDGRCELIVSNAGQQAIYEWFGPKMRWTKLPFTLPTNAMIVNKQGKDHGLRFVDVNEDGYDDILFSNDEHYGLYLFEKGKGWSRKVFAGKRDDKAVLPRIATKGTNNGAWVHSRSLWWSNETTPLLNDHVARLTFNQMLRDVQPGPKSPQASLKCMKPRPGFTVELVAAEPLVQDPVAFDWGADGKLWVVEMGDYPNGLDDKGKPGGKIKFLEDKDGDGKYDKATVFLDAVPFPTGVMPWRKGVLVGAAPEIFYAEDTDGDGKADVRKSLYVGFGEGNQQHRVNGFAWGLDNWIYVANGDSGGNIKSVKTGKTVNVGGRDLRIRPDTGELEAQSGQTQFGRNRDDWGNWFGNNNSNPMWHYALRDHYLKRNPHFAPPSPKVNVSVKPGASPVFPISRTLARFNDPEKLNRFTSACSAMIYRDDFFGPRFAGNSFVSEPVHNLVHREIVRPKGVTFISSRALDEQASHFLASSDNWFRPTMVKTGPDGALWIADYYRHVIEHPKWIPQEWQKKLDLRAGDDKGRIYRVYPIGKKPRRIPRLDKLSTSQLVAALDSPSGWQRDAAQQLLIERNEPKSVRMLEKLRAESKRPLARLHALCTLDGMGKLRPVQVATAMIDKSPGVRRHAARLSEQFVNRMPRIVPALTKLVNDADAQVQMQAAYSLGAWHDTRSGEALARLAVQRPDDRYFTAAILSSLHKENLSSMILTIVLRAPKKKQTAPLLGQLLAVAQRMGGAAAMGDLLTELSVTDEGKLIAWRMRALASFLDVLDQRGTDLDAMKSKADAKLKAAIGQVERCLAAARAMAERDTSLDEREAAVLLMGRQRKHLASDLAALSKLLRPQMPIALQRAAVESMTRLPTGSVPGSLLAGWKGHSPALRAQILDALLAREKWTTHVLDAVEKKTVSPLDVDAVRRQRLLKHQSPTIRERAAKLLGGRVNPDREKIVAQYRAALTMKGDAMRGKMIFTKSCAACHRIGDVGKEIGPDLMGLSNPTAETMLVAILNPNQAVEAKFVEYVANTKRGRTFTGVLTNETSTSISLVGVDGKQVDVLRSDLETLTSAGKSAMPEGMEKDLNLQQMSDLLTFLRDAVSRRKRGAIP